MVKSLDEASDEIADFIHKGRIKDSEAIRYVKHLGCAVCHKSPNDAHHVKSKGSGGHDILENLCPLCREHHSELHQLGLNRFAIKYHGMRQWLAVHGWKFDGFFERWHRLTDKGFED